METKKCPQDMTEEEYVNAYKDLKDLNEQYLRARWKWMHREITWHEVATAYNTTDAHKKEVPVRKPKEKLA